MKLSRLDLDLGQGMEGVKRVDPFLDLLNSGLPLLIPSLFLSSRLLLFSLPQLMLNGVLGTIIHIPPAEISILVVK